LSSPSENKKRPGHVTRDFAHTEEPHFTKNLQLRREGSSVTAKLLQRKCMCEKLLYL